MGAPRALEQLAALVGDERVVAAGVVLAALAPQQPVALHAVDEARQAAAAEQHAVGQLGHAQAARRARRRGTAAPRRTTAGCRARGQLGVERLGHPRVHAQQPAPRAELLAVEQLGRLGAKVVAHAMSLAHRLRPADGDPEGALVLFHGRGTNEDDLFPLLDELDPERRLLGATRARSARRSRPAAPTGT